MPGVVGKAARLPNAGQSVSVSGEQNATASAVYKSGMTRNHSEIIQR